MRASAIVRHHFRASLPGGCKRDSCGPKRRSLANARLSSSVAASSRGCSRRSCTARRDVGGVKRDQVRPARLLAVPACGYGQLTASARAAPVTPPRLARPRRRPTRTRACRRCSAHSSKSSRASPWQKRQAVQRQRPTAACTAARARPPSASPFAPGTYPWSLHPLARPRRRATAAAQGRRRRIHGTGGLRRWTCPCCRSSAPAGAAPRAATLYIRRTH